MDSSCNNTVVDDLSERTSETSVDGFGLSELLVLVASTVIHPHEPLSSPINGLCELQVPAASIASTVIHIQKIFRLDCLEGLILTYPHWHYELHGEQNLKFLRLFSANRSNRP